MEHPSVFSSARSPGVRLTDLPDELTSFIGRSAELARVRELLGEARLLTLVGAGGCGKTRLALQSAVGALDRFGDAWWVGLAALEDADLLASSVSSALGLREQAGQATQETLREYLRDRRALLVLDNCEHLLEPCALLVDTLVRSCPALVVLATSREALRVPGELPYRVPSLTLPAEMGSLGEVTQADSVRLFVDRAVQARHNFALTEDNAGAVAAICRELDGIPLAIELAAARVRMLSPERIAKELDDRFGLLTDGGRTIAARHETLRASIDWSHDLCSEEERVLLRRLSVWVGGFTLEGAEAVSADEALDRRAVLAPLIGLVDKYLVDTEARGDEIRFRMLETIRQYAAERLDDADEVDAARTRHLAWCLDLAERTEPELVSHEAGTSLSRLEPEAANLRAALEWAMAGDREAGLHLAAALTFFWLLQGRLEEGTTALARALEGAPTPTATHGKVLWGLAELSVRRGDFGACLGYAERALEDGEAAGAPSVMARALKARGQIASKADHLKGRADLERSVELARETGDEWCTANAMRLLAESYVRQSEHAAARPILEDCYARGRALGYRPLYAAYFNLRAWGELEHGRLRAARELAERAEHEPAEAVTIGLATALLIECDVLEGAPAEGRARAEPYLELMRKAGVGPSQVWAESALVLADVAEGSPEAAQARIEAMLRAIEGGPSYHMEAKLRRRLAVVLRLLGDLDGAEGEARWLLAHARTGRNEYLEAIADHLLGRLALEQGEVTKAEGHLHEALAIATRRDFRMQTLNSLESLAHVAALSRSPAEAARLLAAVRSARELSGIVRWPEEREVWARVEADMLAELGEEDFATFWAEGAALPIPAAVDYATRARGKRARPLRGWESLTPTELEVLRHIAGGLTNPQIGGRMFISRNTVKTHLSHIFAKLGVSSRAELAAEAAKRGLGAPGADTAN